MLSWLSLVSMAYMSAYFSSFQACKKTWAANSTLGAWVTETPTCPGVILGVTPGVGVERGKIWPQPARKKSIKSQTLTFIISLSSLFPLQDRRGNRAIVAERSLAGARYVDQWGNPHLAQSAHQMAQRKAHDIGKTALQRGYRMEALILDGISPRLIHGIPGSNIGFNFFI